MKTNFENSYLTIWRGKAAMEGTDRWVECALTIRLKVSKPWRIQKR